MTNTANPAAVPAWSMAAERFRGTDGRFTDTTTAWDAWKVLLRQIVEIGNLAEFKTFLAQQRARVAPYVKAARIAATGGLPARELVTRTRAAANAEAFFGPLGGAP